jgi:serine/threonine-protein kinase
MAKSTDGTMVYIPGGPAFIGGASLYAPQPSVETDLADFWIDLTAVTNREFARFVDRTGFDTIAERDGDTQTWRLRATSGRDEHPVVFVAWADAVAYCENVSKRLPNEAEWEKAARGTDGRLWPWGNEWSPELANTLEGGRGSTAPVGTYPAGESPYGIMDMAGNVWQWTASSSSEGGVNPMAGASITGQKVLRGGSWRTIANGTQTTYRKFAPPDYRRDSVGFRCAASGRGENDVRS